MKELQKRLIFLVKNHYLSTEFEHCLETLLEQYEGGIFGELCKLHFQMNNGVETKDVKEVLDLLELWVLFTDILDDVEDGDEAKWGRECNILVNSSTALISIVLLELQKLAMPHQNEVIRLFSSYLLQATDGQHHDLLNQITSEETYINVIKKKSGSLIALACTLGETLATGKFTPELETSAYYTSIVAQLSNDYEDLLGMQRDVIAKKKTLPILYLLQYEDSMFDELRAYYRQQERKAMTTRITFQQIEASGLPIYIHLMKLKYRNLAFDLLQQLYPNKDISKFEQYI